MKLPIYMDNHATTRTDPRVVEAMLPYFTEVFGNPSSRSHVFGWKAEEAVEAARAQVAALIGATPKEIVFTSGATESDNLAVRGVARAYREKGDHIVTCVTEHPAVLDSCRLLESDGFRVTYLPVGPTGRVDPDQVRRALTDRTILVSIMFANNEVGTIHPVAEIGRIAHEAGVLYHCDGVQALGRVPVDVVSMGIDLLSLSAHKMYGPKGVGALYVRRRNPRVRLAAIVEGGGQENRLRSGTLNVPGIVGLGAACAVAGEEMPAESARLLALRETLHRTIAGGLDEVELNGDPVHRLPGNLNVSFGRVQGEALLLAMKDVAVSSGSACTSTTVEASHVLTALGVSEERAQASLRYGLGRFNTAEEVDYVGALTVETVRRLRSGAPIAAAFQAARAASG